MGSLLELINKKIKFNNDEFLGKDKIMEIKKYKDDKNARIKDFIDILGADDLSQKSYVLKRLDDNIKFKKQIERLYAKMVRQGSGLKNLLFSKWKNMPDSQNEHRIASKIEAKMDSMINKSLSAGLKPLEQEVIDGQNRQVLAARALIQCSESNLKRMYDKWRNSLKLDQNTSDAQKI